MQVTHEVEVDVRRDVQFGTLHPIGAIEAHIKVPYKAERLRHSRRKAKVDVPEPIIQLQGVEDVVFVERRAERRKGRDELLAIEVDVILIEIHFREHFRLEEGHKLFGHHIIHTGMLFSFGDGAVQVACILPVMLLNAFVGRNWQHWSTRYYSGVDEVFDELELLLPTGKVTAAEVVQRIGHVVIASLTEVVIFLGRMVVLVFDDVAYQDDSRVVLAAIAFTFGLDHHFAQLHVLREHLDSHIHLTIAGHDGLRVVAKITELNDATWTGEHREVALCIGDSAVGSTFFRNVYKVERLASDAVQHLSLHGDTCHLLVLIPSLCRQSRRHRSKQKNGEYRKKDLSYFLIHTNFYRLLLVS